jgi:hypothetical protein
MAVRRGPWCGGTSEMECFFSRDYFANVISSHKMGAAKRFDREPRVHQTAIDPAKRGSDLGESARGSPAR